MLCGLLSVACFACSMHLHNLILLVIASRLDLLIRRSNHWYGFPGPLLLLYAALQ